MSAARIGVLIVEDHPIFRDGLRRSLADSGIEVLGEAASGQSAVELAQRLRPDLMLLDLSLPDFSGLEVLRRLGEAGRASRTLILTANIDRAEIAEALRLGARGVVMKDAGSDLLLKSIRAVTAGEYWVGRELIANYLDFLKRKSPDSTITARERQVIDYAVSGLTNREIGGKLGISEETVKRHMRNIYDKLGISSRVELALRVTSEQF